VRQKKTVPSLTKYVPLPSPDSQCPVPIGGTKPAVDRTLLLTNEPCLFLNNLLPLLAHGTLAQRSLTDRSNFPPQICCALRVIQGAQEPPARLGFCPSFPAGACRALKPTGPAFHVLSPPVSS
jgi:hypothetical protein